MKLGSSAHGRSPREVSLAVRLGRVLLVMAVVAAGLAAAVNTGAITLPRLAHGHGTQPQAQAHKSSGASRDRSGG